MRLYNFQKAKPGFLSLGTTLVSNLGKIFINLKDPDICLKIAPKQLQRETLLRNVGLLVFLGKKDCSTLADLSFTSDKVIVYLEVGRKKGIFLQIH